MNLKTLIFNFWKNYLHQPVGASTACWNTWMVIFTTTMMKILYYVFAFQLYSQEFYERKNKTKQDKTKKIHTAAGTLTKRIWRLCNNFNPQLWQFVSASMATTMNSSAKFLTVLQFLILMSWPLLTAFGSWEIWWQAQRWQQRKQPNQPAQLQLLGGSCVWIQSSCWCNLRLLYVNPEILQLAQVWLHHQTVTQPDHRLSKPLDISSNTKSTMLEFAATSTSWSHHHQQSSIHTWMEYFSERMAWDLKTLNPKPHYLKLRKKIWWAKCKMQHLVWSTH